jgi:hypothetical protein
MDQLEAAEILRKLRKEHAEAAEALSASQRRLGALAKVIEGYLELFPSLAQPSGDSVAAIPEDDGRPRGQDAVMQVLESIENRGRYWTVGQMVEELARRGWLPDSRGGDPGNAVRAALARAADSSDRVHKGRGRTGTIVYFFQHDGMEPPHFVGPQPGGPPPPRRLAKPPSAVDAPTLGASTHSDSATG